MYLIFHLSEYVQHSFQTNPFFLQYYDLVQSVSSHLPMQQNSLCSDCLLNLKYCVQYLRLVLTFLYLLHCKHNWNYTSIFKSTEITEHELEGQKKKIR